MTREFIEKPSGVERVVVFDMMDHLRRAFEDFLNTYHKPISDMERLMGIHNFHKFIVIEIADRMQFTGDERAVFLRTARDTFDKAMTVEIEKAGDGHG